MIRELDESLQAAVLLVPADGNCLAWSMRSLYLSQWDIRDFKKKNVLKSATHMRSILRDMWLEKTTDDRWIQIFAFCYQDLIQPLPEPEAKAPKRRADADAGAQSKLRRAAAAVPVPITAGEAVDPVFKCPASGKIHEFLEPQMPDVEAVVSDSLLKVYSKATRIQKLPGADFDPKDWEPADETKRRQKRHSRMVQKKPADMAKMRDQAVGKFLASRQLGYGDFLRIHRREAVFRKSGKCPDGFAKLREGLIAGRMPKCEVCSKWMCDANVTLEMVQQVLTDLAEAPPRAEAADAQKQESEGKQSRAEIRAACVEFINGIPHLEAVDGAVLQYRCNICQSKRMRDGKLNRLGDKPTLHGVKSFMTEHLNSQGHVRALARLTNVPLPEVATEPAADLPEVAAPGFAELACDGYSVSNPASSGTLHWYSHEFGLWATHTKLDAKASHTYHQHPNHGGWVVKHKD